MKKSTKLTGNETIEFLIEAVYNYMDIAVNTALKVSLLNLSFDTIMSKQIIL